MENHTFSLLRIPGYEVQTDMPFLPNESTHGLNTSSRATSSGDLSLTLLVKYMNLYYIPVLILVGLVGNIVSFIVFSTTQLKNLSSSVYLAALALADTGCLLNICVSWMVNIRVNLYHMEGWCQTFVYLTYVFSFLSVCYVVSFTIERFIAVCFPLKRQQLCTVNRARIVVIVEAIFGLSAYSFAIWTSGAHKYKTGTLCYPRKQYYKLVNILGYVDSILTLILPVFVIIIVNVSLVYKITFVYDSLKLQAPARTRRDGSESPICGRTQNMSTSNRRQVRITKMLVVVSSVFVVLNLPSHAMRIYNFIMLLSGGRHEASRLEMHLQQLFQLLYYTHFSVNFFLYSLCGKNFRKAMALALCARKERKYVTENQTNVTLRSNIRTTTSTIGPSLAEESTICRRWDCAKRPCSESVALHDISCVYKAQPDNSGERDDTPMDTSP